MHPIHGCVLRILTSFVTISAVQAFSPLAPAKRVCFGEGVMVCDKEAADGIRTHNVHLGKVALYR